MISRVAWAVFLSPFRAEVIQRETNSTGSVSLAPVATVLDLSGVARKANELWIRVRAPSPRLVLLDHSKDPRENKLNN